jgi:NADPH:quinone reductase-like Zn-dependent oxidoreductase
MPKDGEILIRIHATTVTSGDWRVRSLEAPLGFRLIMRLVLPVSKPRQPIPGTELAGVVEAVGNAPFSRCGASLKIPWLTMRTGKKLIAGPAAGKAEDLRFLAGLAQKGEYRPVIDRVYPFDQIREAFGRVETGHKKGNLVITLLSAGSEPS